MEENLAMLNEPDDDGDGSSDDSLSDEDDADPSEESRKKRALRLSKAPELTTVAFQIRSEHVETVKR